MSRAARSALVLALCLAVCFAAAGLGGLATSRSVRTWYQKIERPGWTPPDWLFGPVWTVLYATMAVAAWLVWRRAGWTGARAALALFAVQLFLNAGWSWLFFGLQSPGAALAELVVLWCAIVATVVAFWRVTPAAGLLLLPYLLWSTFAAALNLAIWRMNA